MDPKDFLLFPNIKFLLKGQDSPSLAILNSVGGKLPSSTQGAPPGFAVLADPWNKYMGFQGDNSKGLGIVESVSV